MRRPSRTNLSWVLVIFLPIPTTAQDLAAIGREKPFSLSGGLSFNQVWYASRGGTARRDPYSFHASGNANIALYGWHIPLTFTASNHSTAFRQPFNQYALHPRWKWITVHAGHTSMSFSPYTVNGHIFRGVGVDLDPGENWHVSALYGRFLKAVSTDTAKSFRRNGYAFRIRYGGGNDFVETIVFHAKDQHGVLQDSLRAMPQQNAVAGIAASKTVLRSLVLRTELATSALTRDTRAQTTESYHPLTRVKFFFPARVSTSYYEAFNASATFQRKQWSIGTRYERVEPGYTTFGAYYFNNDLENISLTTTIRLLNERLTFTLSSGIQRDNIEGDGISTLRRVVNACHITFTPSQKFNLLGSWSTFQAFTNLQAKLMDPEATSPYDLADTLDYKQISSNASLSVMYAPDGRNDRRQHIALNIAVQTSTDAQGAAVNHSATTFGNVNASYTVSFVPQQTTVSLMFNTSAVSGTMMNTLTAGPSASVSKSFLNRKLRTSLSTSWNMTRRNETGQGWVLNARLHMAGSIGKRHGVSVNAVLIRRTPSFLEFTATAGYQYTFSRRE